MNPAPSDRSAWHHSAERQPMQQYLTRRLVFDFHFPGFLVCIISFSRQYVYLNDFECIYIYNVSSCIIYMLFNLLYRFFYPTGCTKPIVAAGFFSKNPSPMGRSPWDAGWGGPYKNQHGWPPPYKKKKHPSGFFVFAEKVGFWCFWPDGSGAGFGWYKWFRKGYVLPRVNGGDAL